MAPLLRRSAALVLANKDDRKGTVLAFNETTGAVEIGPTIADTNSIAQIKAPLFHSALTFIDQRLDQCPLSTLLVASFPDDPLPEAAIQSATGVVNPVFARWVISHGSLLLGASAN